MSQPLDQLIQVRTEKLQALKELGVNPFPATATRSHSIIQAREMEGQAVAIAGRIRSVRSHGNLYFFDLEDDSGRIQIMARKQELSEPEFKLVKKLDTGDFLAVQGPVFTTQAGELTVQIKTFQLLTKSLRPLPDEWYGLKDNEERYRKRYLDMILNPEVKDHLKLRSKVLNAIRSFLINEGFVEIESPVLEVNASGAMAKPFATHINAYDMDLYLRICNGELWQKKLMVGGLEKTFEMGRAFRNEGVDREHNPEFTEMEYYWAYADYKMNMDLQERFFEYVVKNALDNPVITLEDKRIDFTPPYPRKTIRELILEKTQIDIDQFTDAQSLGQKMTEYGFKIDPKWGRGHLIDEFYKEYVRPYLTGPIFVTHHPKDLKPLAKEDPDYPGYTQSFQLLVNGFEVSNNYSELNDPIDQKERFTKQKELAEGGDDETMSADQEFVEALEYGMPPVTGTGIGIDRLVALLANAHHIREVIAFPLMKPRVSGKGVLQYAPTASSPEGVQLNAPTPEGQLPDEGSKRFIAVLNGKIEIGRLMNALGHMTAGLTGSAENSADMQFLDYKDKEGTLHLPISHYPFIVLKADNSNKINTLRKELEARGIRYNVFTDTMTVGSSQAQVEATASKTTEELEYYGLVMFADNEAVADLTKKFSLFR